MYSRSFWLRLLEESLQSHPIVWLAGVRRAGKTVLCQDLPAAEYFDCELPSVRRSMEDPERFLGGLAHRRVILDEIHRLANPSELLKIAADHYPTVRIVATGSSSLGASQKFRDTLTGRKKDIWLTPMNLPDASDFGQTDPEVRMVRGGLPPFFLDASRSERAYQDWLDAFWAKDILELFRLERRASFLRFAELLFAQSGGIFEATRFSAPCEVSRTTIANYLAVLEATFVAHVIRPYSARRAMEIVAAPRVYAFDTGFVCMFRGTIRLTPKDRGSLWEHLVLNELHAHLQRRDIMYWRDKRGHEVDFVVPQRREGPTAIECKLSCDAFDPSGMAMFRKRHPRGRNYVAVADTASSVERRFGGMNVKFVNLLNLVAELAAG
jgi:predicted AAA+ superfamily ATPase